MGRVGSIFLVIAVATLSCAQAPPPASTGAQAVKAAPPAFEPRTVERSQGDCSAEAAPCARFVAHFPVLTGGVSSQVRDAVNRSISRLVARAGAFITAEEEGAGHVPATVDEAARDFLATWFQDREELPDDAPAAYSRWADERRMEVIHADPQVLSVELTLYAFTGGAHPNTFIKLVSYDLATGEPLQLEDLLAAGAEPRLDELGERLFRRTREIPEGETLEEAGFWLEGDRFELTDNFAVTAEGLVFVFNPYEVAPYVFGPTRVTVPWRDLRSLLRPGAPVSGPIGR